MRIPTRLVLGSLLLSAVSACTSGTHAPLTSRGLPERDRYDYITQNGYEVGPELREAFVNGKVTIGMRREFVFQLFGAPDRNSEVGSGWEYLDKRGRLVTGVLFKGEIVDSVYGDPAGGAPRLPASR